MISFLRAREGFSTFASNIGTKIETACVALVASGYQRELIFETCETDRQNTVKEHGCRKSVNDLAASSARSKWKSPAASKKLAVKSQIRSALQASDPLVHEISLLAVRTKRGKVETDERR
jgi:hypothetical protein